MRCISSTPRQYSVKLFAINYNYLRILGDRDEMKIDLRIGTARHIVYETIATV